MGVEKDTSTNENWLVNAVRKLRADGIIRRDNDVAEATGYSAASISNMLEGRVKLSEKFKIKFYEVYPQAITLTSRLGESELNYMTTGALYIKHNKLLEEQVVLQKEHIEMLKNEIENLRDKLARKKK